MQDKFRFKIGNLIIALEFTLAIFVIIGTIWYLFLGINNLWNDFGQNGFFSELIKVFLSVIIGIEVARVLITHSMVGLIEVFGFLLARKALTPETSALDILVIIIAFCVLIFARKEVCRQGSVDDGLCTR
jgi:hypothetical protein